MALGTAFASPTSLEARQKAPGVGDVKSIFNERGMTFSHDTEVVTASYYSVDLEAGVGKIHAEQTASTYLAH